MTLFCTGSAVGQLTNFTDFTADAQLLWELQQPHIGLTR